MAHKIWFATIFWFFVACVVCASELRTASYFGDEMVLQRDWPIKVWGTSAPKAKITANFSGQSAQTTADATGRWVLTLPKTPASYDGVELVVSDDRDGTQVFKDVVVGDVWLCAGQSNMGGPIKMDPSGAEAKKTASDKFLRIININPDFYTYPLDDFPRPSEWGIAVGKHLDWQSAVAFFFGQAVRARCEVPIGLVVTSRGGTGLEAFMPVAAHLFIPPEAAPHATQVAAALRAKDLTSATGKALFAEYLQAWQDWQAANKSRLAVGEYPPSPPIFGRDTRAYSVGNLYNAMISPLRRVGFRGMIWYQGETNGSQQSEYYQMLKAFVLGIRQTFSNPQIAFYLVQLAPYGKPEPVPGSGTGTAGVRHGQLLVARELSNAGIAVTLDVGDPEDIHPANKKDVGERLARWALHNEYGQTDLVPSGPLYKSHRIDVNKIILEFDYVGGGLMVGKKDGQQPVVEDVNIALRQFAIAGKDLQFKPANALIDGDTVVVSSEEVPNPVAVRYAYEACPIGANLYNREGLPAAAFKTDPW